MTIDLETGTPLQLETGVDFTLELPWQEALDNPIEDIYVKSEGGNWISIYASLIQDRMTVANKTWSSEKITEQDNLRTRWMGEWAAGEYLANEQVLDDGWLMIANKTTTDPAAPDRIGVPFYAYAGTMLEDTSSGKQVIFGNRYTFGATGYLTGYRIYTVTGQTYRVFAVSASGEIKELSLFTANVTGWVSFGVSAVFIVLGASFDLVAVTQEPDDTPVTVTANYNYQTPQNPSVPAAGAIQHSRGQPDVMAISYEDSDGTDRTSIIQGLSIGDVIDGAGQRWAIQANVDQGGYASISVAPALTGSPTGIQAFDFETKATTPITYGFDTDYWLSNPPNNGSAQGLLGIDQDYGSIIPNDTAYGTDIQVQIATVSPDWDFMAYTDTTGGSNQLSQTERVWVQASSQLIDQERVTTSGNTWAELLRFTVQPGEALVASLVVEGFRQDAFDIFYQEVRVVTTNDGGLVTTITPIIEQSPHPQVESRYQGSGNEVVLEVRGRSGQDWRWKCTVFFNGIDP